MIKMLFHTKGASYGYELTGKGETIVLLHGFTGNKNTWDSFVNQWAKQFQVLTVDLPGHGETNVENERSMNELCRDLNDLFNYLNVSSIHLLGYSMGGRVALSYALNFPERVSTLILESASPGLNTEKERMKRRKSDEQLAQMILNNGIKPFIDYWENISLFDTQKKLPARIREDIRKERLSATKEGLSLSLRTLGTGNQPSWWEHLHELKIPVYLLVGNLDEKFVKINREMKKSLPNATLEIVRGVGHAIHVEDDEKFAKLVEGFIKNYI